jgi:hypothetical protein
MMRGMSKRHLRVAAGLYVVLAGSLAIAGGVAQSPVPYLTDVLVTLPLGLAAFVAIYLGYALIQGVGGLFLATTTADGSQAEWLRVSSASQIVVLFVVAALGNIAILRRVQTSRRRNAHAAPLR